MPGIAGIVPLTTAEALLEEGEQQANCVASYVWRVLAGQTYIYRITAPERATLAITRLADGCWHRIELKGPCNRKVSDVTIRCVDTWLSRHRVSI